MSSASISIAKGKGSIRHNNRDFIADNVNPDKIKDNIIYKQEPLFTAYEKCFSQAIDEYNLKQKRSDRKINGVEGYMEQIRTSGNGEKLYYENVVQVGNMFDNHVNSEQGQVAKKVLDDYMKDFQERNPNLYVFNAVLHLDEQTPHLHIDYIPLADGYKNGLQVRNSLDRALKQQGLEGKANKYENRTIAWQKAEKDHIEEIMKKYGIERAEDKGLDREHLTVNQYKAVAERIRNEVKQIPKEIDANPTLLNKDKVTVKKEDLEQLEHRAKLSIVHEKTTKNLVSGIKKDLENTKNYTTKKISMALDYENKAIQEQKRAKEERFNAERMHEKYLKLYKEQEHLNEKYEKLQEVLEDQKQTISKLHTEHDKALKELTNSKNNIIAELENKNSAFKAQIFDLSHEIEKKVHMATEPLKEQIESLKTHLKGSMQSLTNVIKAVGMLRHENEHGYKADLTDRQTKLIDAVTEYSKSWIDRDGEGLNDDTAKNCKEDIDRHIEISKGIKSFMAPDYPDRLIFKGGDQGRGFYDKDKNFYGGKEILKDLKEHGVKISDPYELLPGGRSL